MGMIERAIEPEKKAPYPIRVMMQWLSQRFMDEGVSQLTICWGAYGRFSVGEPKGQTVIPIMRIKKPIRLMRKANGGLLGWAEAYMEGAWLTDDLRQLVDWAMANEQALETAFQAGQWRQWWHRVLHLSNDNSKRGSQKNIAAHYDLGNEFYRLWLDKSMTYSSALFSSGQESLEEGQQHKYDTILKALALRKDHSVLEIGCGWGGFAQRLKQHAFKDYTGITLSKAQLAYAKDTSDDEKQSFALLDYRDVAQTYDKVVSIEMFEAVGEKHWDTYFQTLYRCLNSGGAAVLQVITIDESRFEVYRQGADFIQRYIFPGGMLPTHSLMCERISQAGLTLQESRSFGQDYAKTLYQWYENFNRAWADIAPLGFDEVFKRMWNYYLAYCEAGFLYKSIDVRHYHIHKPEVG